MPPSCCTRRSRRRSPLAALTLLLPLLAALPSLAQSIPTTPQSSALNNGSKAEAIQYYKDLSKKLNFLTPATIESKGNMQELLNYLGYSELTAEIVEFEDPEKLMGGGSTPPPAPAFPYCGKSIELKSFKGDSLNRPDTAQGVTSASTGTGNLWTAECVGGKVRLKSSKGDYLHRPDTAQGVTSWHTGPGNAWTVVERSGPTPPPRQPGDILVSRFFAPKIVNFAVPPAQREIGWRRLVRINSRTGSEARKHGVESAWILFNHFTKPPTHKPFLNTPDTSSANTQVALVTNCAVSPTACQEGTLNSIYWLDFGGTVTQGGKLSYALDAFFDAGALVKSGKQPGAPYFLPNGCDTCHGTLKNNAVLNTLDTDHWMDRVTDGDFPALAAPGAPAPLFDAGKDPKSAQYAAGFEVIRKLNDEINTMQQRVRPGGFHQKATAKWLELHKSSPAPVTDLVQRAFDFSNTGHPLQRSRKAPLLPAQMWKPVAEDRELLGLLNKYCYRCHGAVRFDVFSKDMVADEASPILDRVDANATQQQIQGFKMPPDRDMDAKDKARLLELMDKLYIQTH